MDPRNFIITRIDLRLRRHLGLPVDTHRALTDARYSRDLLLVCDAMAGTELPELAIQYRAAEEKTSAARRALAPRVSSRRPVEMPPLPAAGVAQRPVTFNRAR